MAKDEFRIKQGRIRRNSDEIGVRSALISVHRLIEDRIRRRRGLPIENRLDARPVDRHLEMFIDEDARLDDRAALMRESLTPSSGRSDVILHPKESRRRRWDRIALVALIVAALAFAAALWMRFGSH